MVEFVFGLLSIGMLGAGLAFIIMERKRARKRRSWDYTKGRIIRHVNKQIGSMSDWPKVEFEVDGTLHQATSDMGQNPSPRIGKEVGVFYNPENPDEIILDTFIQRGGMLFLAGIFFLFMGTIFFRVFISFFTNSSF